MLHSIPVSKNNYQKIFRGGINMNARADIFYGLSLVHFEELDPVTLQASPSGASVWSVANEEFTLEPEISEGEHEHLRSRGPNGRVLAQVKEPDLLLGYNLELVQNIFSPDILQLATGMVAKSDGTGWTSPMLSEGASNSKKFRTTLYVANYDGANIKDYGVLTCAVCEGTPSEISVGNEFTSPEFEIWVTEDSANSIPALDLSYVTSLPNIPQSALKVLMPHIPEAVQKQLDAKRQAKVQSK